MSSFKDLLLKIANNARLTPQELDDLGRFGTETQQKNSLVSGWTDITTNKEPIHSSKNVGVQARRVAAQAISDSTGVAVIWDTIDYQDTNNFYNSSISTTKLVIPEPGYYLIMARGVFTFSATNNGRKMWVAINGVNLDISTSFGDRQTGQNISTIVVTQPFLSKDDYVEVFASQISGGNLDFICTCTISKISDR